MLDLVIYEDGEEIYRKENQELILASTDNDWFIRGGSSVDDLIILGAEVLSFLHDTISSCADTIDIFEFLHRVLGALKCIYKDNNLNQTILNFSNPEDIFNAIQTCLALSQEVKDKLPKNYRFLGIDYDELLKQMGDKDEKNN